MTELCSSPSGKSTIYRKLPLGSESPVVRQTFEVTRKLKTANNSLRWGAMNALGVAILSYDMSLTDCHRYSSHIYQIEYVLVMILSLNTLYHVWQYLYNKFKARPVPVTPRQKQLLGFKDTDSYFKIVNQAPNNNSNTPKSDKKCSTPRLNCTTTPLNTSTLSWRTTSTQNESIYSVPSPSWVYYRGSPSAGDHRGSPAASPMSGGGVNTSQKCPIPDTSGIENIDDEKSLNSYLKDYETHEKMLNVSSALEDSTNLLSSFWNHPATRSCSEVSTFLKNSTYQLASQAMETFGSGSPGKGLTDGNTSPISLQNEGMEIWSKLKVDSNTLTLWHSNLRMWIYQTILHRLVDEIDCLNEALHRHNFVDVQIGAVGLERLRKTAQTQLAQQYVPTLCSLIPFLEVNSNQEYLVKRIQELAKGGSMSEYRWNSGSTFNGKQWEDHLPTDAAIVMHLMATYLDTQLVPLPHQPDARPFSTRHLCKGSSVSVGVEGGSNQLASVVIRQVTDKPPHYNLNINGKTQELSKGCNNLFHAWLLFIHQQDCIEHGMIGRVNLGKSGLNMLWIIGK